MFESKVRHNYWAILVAALTYFVLGAVWFTLSMKPWMEGIGRSMEWFTAHPYPSPVIPYATAFLAAAVMALALSYVIQLTGPQTATRGMRIAALLWLAFVFTTWATEYGYEERGITILAINTGYVLIGLVIEGAIVGAWKKR
jgi:hypothetical protein